jgi:hypothetical protein
VSQRRVVAGGHVGYPDGVPIWPIHKRHAETITFGIVVVKGGAWLFADTGAVIRWVIGSVTDELAR